MGGGSKLSHKLHTNGLDSNRNHCLLFLVRRQRGPIKNLEGSGWPGIPWFWGRPATHPPKDAAQKWQQLRIGWCSSACRGRSGILTCFCRTARNVGATTAGPMHLELELHKRNHHREKPEHHNGEEPLLTANQRKPEKSREDPARPENKVVKLKVHQPPCGCGLAAKSCPTRATPWAIALQAPLSMGFSRQEYWSGLPFPNSKHPLP